jgi:hypothetical protein
MAGKFNGDRMETGMADRLAIELKHLRYAETAERCGSVRRVLNELQIVVDRAKAVDRGEAEYLTIGFYTSLSGANTRRSARQQAYEKAEHGYRGAVDNHHGSRPDH